MLLIKNVPIIVLISVALLIATDAAPYQELEPREGYVPVYIRLDNAPLSEIHPGLAEAFKEIESASLLVETNKETSAELTKAKLNEKEKKESTEKAATEIPTEEKTATETPAIVVEEKSNNKESDIASFDVVKALESKDNSGGTTNDKKKE